MKRTILISGIGALWLTACGGPPGSAETHATVRSAMEEERPDNYRAVLSGREEVPQRDTRGRGVAIFQLQPDGMELHYQLNVANIENVVAVHIHLGAEGANGPVVAFLFGPVAPGGGRTDGVLAEGTLTQAKLVGPLAGKSLEDLIDAMEAGSAYVNVHTNDGVAPANTGPGDFASGELRGQIWGGR